MNDEVTVNETRTYSSDKEYVLFSADRIKLGFIKMVDNAFNLTMNIDDATKFTATESNRLGSKFDSEHHITPYKFKVCEYKKLKIF